MVLGVCRTASGRSYQRRNVYLVWRANVRQQRQLTSMTGCVLCWLSTRVIFGETAPLDRTIKVSIYLMRLSLYLRPSLQFDVMWRLARQYIPAQDVPKVWSIIRAHVHLAFATHGSMVFPETHLHFYLAQAAGGNGKVTVTSSPLHHERSTLEV